MFEVIEGGLITTVQDCGRPGYQALGIPPSGAFDGFSLRLGNLLVGNDPGGRYFFDPRSGAAALEATIVGPKLKFLRGASIAVTGANLTPMLNGKSLPMWRVVTVKEGDILSFGGYSDGCRTYICFAGGIDLPKYLGSRSTYLRGSVGGLGRALQRGDMIRLARPEMPGSEVEGRFVKPETIPRNRSRQEIRVVLGPQDYLFTEESIDEFKSAWWRVSQKADRMGYRYVGPKLKHKPVPDYLRRWMGDDSSNIVDDPTIPGSIQWASTEMIILGVDSITLGGFTKPATVISADLPKLGQSKPGDEHHFVPVEVAEAIGAMKELENKISEASIGV